MAKNKNRNKNNNKFKNKKASPLSVKFGGGDAPSESQKRSETFPELCAQILELLKKNEDSDKDQMFKEAIPDIKACMDRASDTIKTEGPRWPDVFSELALELLPHVPKQLRQLITHAFALISNQINEESLGKIIELSYDLIDEANQDGSDTDGSDSVADSDGELEVKSEDDEEDDEEDEDDDEGDEVDDEFRLKLVQALGPVAMCGSDDDEDQMSEGEAAKLDEAVAAIFREKKAAKSEKKQQAKDVIQLRVQSLSLLEAVIKNKESSASAISKVADVICTILSEASKASNGSILLNKTLSITNTLVSKTLKGDTVVQELGGLLDKVWVIYSKARIGNVKDRLRKIICWLFINLKKNSWPEEELVNFIKPRISKILDSGSTSDFLLLKEIISINSTIARETCQQALQRIEGDKLRPYKRGEALQVLSLSCKELRKMSNDDPQKTDSFADMYNIAINLLFRLLTAGVPKPSEIGATFVFLSTLYSCMNDGIKKSIVGFEENHEKLIGLLAPSSTSNENESSNVSTRKWKKKLDKSATKAFKHLRQPLPKSGGGGGEKRKLGDDNGSYINNNNNNPNKKRNKTTSSQAN